MMIRMLIYCTKLYLLTNLSMGINCVCQNEGRKGVRVQYVRMMREQLYVALGKKKVQCSLGEEGIIDLFLQGEEEMMSQWSGNLDLVLQTGTTVRLIKEINTKIGEMRLVVRFAKRQAEMKSWQVHGKLVNSGIVIYDKGYYMGALINNQPEGKGSFFLKNHQISLVVKGIWNNGLIKEAAIMKDGKKELQIEMKGADKARLTFYLSQWKRKPLYYEGSIKTNYRDSVGLSSIMTGRGKIYFPNGDYYEGQVRNGLMHCERALGAQYYSNESTTRYRGFYRDGKRHGSGRVQIEVNKFMGGQSKDIYAIDVEYVNGVMKQGQVNLKSLTSRESWLMELGPVKIGSE